MELEQCTERAVGDDVGLSVWALVLLDDVGYPVARVFTDAATLVAAHQGCQLPSGQVKWRVLPLPRLRDKCLAGTRDCRQQCRGMGTQPRRRPPRRPGKARSDAERRRLAQASRSRPLSERTGGPVLWCDGGARGNPGPSAFGYVLEAVDGSLLREAGGALGVGTANVAEYRGLIAGLEAAAEFGLRQLEVRIDSQLVVAQLTGERQIKNPTLAAFAERARELGNKVGPVRWRWVSRDHNGRANALVARVLGLQAD
jgi:ribonuclease HI